MTFKTRQEVARELGISARTLTRLIRRESLDVKSGLLSPREQYIILCRLGFTGYMDFNESKELSQIGQQNRAR